MTERRIFPRVEVFNPVLYFIDSHPGPNLAWTLDLSLGGTRIESSNGLITGERFWMQIAILPQTIKCRGRAVYVLEAENGSTKAGIKFEELSAQNRLLLRQYLSHGLERRP
ncbi:MAG: PilZ domain-containing protein [Candidatus Hodarchaeota archaeon]